MSSRLLFVRAVLCAVLFASASALQASPFCAQEKSTYARLSEPAVAAALNLTDEQKKQVAAIRQAGGDDIDSKLAAVLIPKQLALYQSLFSGTRIRFNFRAQKWEQVLDYIADEAGLSLVMNEAPPGVFNYSDSKEYTPSEAVDLVNGWLLTKGYTLIRRERLLMCLPLKDGLPANAVPRIKPEELATRGRFEIVSVLLPLEGRPVDKVQTELEAIKGTYGKVTPLSATGQILITDTAGNIKAMQAIAKAVPLPPSPKPKPKPKAKPPAPKPPAPVMKVYPLRHSNPDKLAEVLKKFVKGTIFVDNQANQVTINAIPTAQKTAEDIINRLEANEGPTKQPSLKIYPIRTRDLDQLMETIELAAPAAKVRVEDDGRRMLAWATPQEQAKVQSVLDQLKASPGETAQARTQLQTYPIERVTPSTAKALLEELLPDARITANDEGKTLIVIGTLNEHQAVKTLVTQIDGQKRGRSAKTYSIKGIANDRLTTVATTLVPLATLSIDAKTDSAVVVASEEEHKLFESVIEQLTASATGAKTELKTYPTADIDIPSVTSLLATLAPKASVTVDSTNERFVVIAAAEDHAKVANVLTQVTQVPEASRELKPYAMPENQSTETVTSLLATVAPSASVTVDAANKRFLIVANGREHEQVAKTLEQLTAGVGEQRELKPYVLKEGQNSGTIVTLLSSLAPEATVTPDADNNRLLIVATPGEHAKVGKTIEQFGNANAAPELRFYPVEKDVLPGVATILSSVAPAAKLTVDETAKRLSVVARTDEHARVKTTLEKLTLASAANEKPGMKLYDVTSDQRRRFTTVAAGLTAQLPGLQIIASGDPRELTIWAKPSQHEVVTRILDQLKRDVPTARKPILAVYPITKVDAAGVQTVLAELFPDAQITLDEKASRLLIKAVAEEQKAIDAAVQQLDTDSPVSTKIKLMAYPVDGLTSRTVVAAIEAEVPGLSIIPDTAAETLIVRGQLRDHEKVAAIIDALRSSAGTLRKRRVVAYPAVFGTPSQTVVFFRSAFSGAQAVVDSTSRRMTVWATDEQHKAIAAAVAEMSGQGEMAAVTKSYPMKGLNATTLTRMLTQAVPDAKFAIDTVDSRLVAWAREADQKTIESIITGATDADHAGRVLQIFEVEPTRLTTTQTVLTNANPDVTFTAAATGNALLAWTSDEQATQIRETIKQLETSEALSTKRELRTFSVKDMNADSARSMLANVFPTVSFLDSPDGASLIANVTARDAKAIEETLGQLKANGIVASKRTMNFYDFKDIGGAEARALIAKAVPNVVFTGAEDRTVAWVLPGEHEKITTLLDELKTNKPFDRGRTLKAYSVRGLGSSASTVLQQAAPAASVVVGAQPEQYLIRATAGEHEKLAETLQQLRTMADSEPKRELKTYSIKGLDAAAVRATLSPLVDGDVQLTVDPTGQQLYVRAFPEKQRAIESVVQAVLKSLPSREGEVTRTYQTEPGDADEVQEAVARLFPNANFAVDREYRVLLATALPEEHKTIETVVQQMSQSTNRKRGVAKTYPIGEAEGDNLAISIQRLYRGTQVRVSYDDAARTLLVVAEDDQHAVIQKLIDDLTTEAANAPVKELATFNIEGLDGKAVQETLRPLLVDEAEVTVDPVGRRLFINAFPEQQKRIATIVQSVLEGLPSRKGVITKSYRVLRGDGDEVAETVQALHPDAVVVTDLERKVVVATALPEEHKAIEEVVKQMVSDGGESRVAAKTYPLGNADGVTLARSLTLMYRGSEAQISYNAGSKSLLAIAREDQHEAIKALLDQMQADAKAMPKKELATFNIEGLDAKAVTKTLTPLVDEDAEITADPTGRRLFVRALPEKREQIEKLVQSVINSLPSRKGVQTKAYRTLVGDADEVKEAIAVLFPDAVVGFDSERKVVVATALPEEHEAIQKVVDQLVADGGETRVSAKTYPLRNADGVALARSLALMYRRTEAQISYDAGTKTLLAVARQDQHEAIAKLVEQLEGADAPEDNRTVEFYSLEGADGLAVRNVVQDLLDQIDPKSSVVNDEGSQQLVVTTIAAGHVKVKDAIARLQQQKLQREIEVFALNRLEPFSAELAVNSLFDDGNTKLRDLPLLQSDNDSQQLIVRGTAEQIEQIRDLLIKMGETGLRKTNPNAKVRVIPVTGDTVEALKGLEKVWPKIRRNPIKVLQPGSRVREIVPGKPVLPKLPAGRGKNQAALRKDAAGTRGLVHYTAFRSKQQDDQLAPVLVVPGNGRITISSDDTEALNQMEALLQAVFSSSGSRRRKDFNVYALTNAAATTVSDLLNNIFKRDDSPIMFGNVVVIPDQRLNALIVFAGRTDRERIEQLIEILDSDNIPETVATARTNVVPIEHADAAKINTVLTGIYKAQMSTGGSRSQVSIPKGVPSSVATVLRQINAASSAPLLNVQVEETTNSLVIMAPQNLMEEVTELVQRLDQAASTSRARGVSIIELQKTNSRRVMDVLNRVLKD